MPSQDRQHLRATLKLMGVCLLMLGLSGCGNKGPLYRINEPAIDKQSVEYQHAESRTQEPQSAE